MSEALPILILNQKFIYLFLKMGLFMGQDQNLIQIGIVIFALSAIHSYSYFLIPIPIPRFMTRVKTVEHQENLHKILQIDNLKANWQDGPTC